jgi:Tol biopolymer transport system component
VRQLTWPPAASLGDHVPAVSPDGKILAFGRETAWRTSELYFLDLAPGLSPIGGPRRVTDLGYVGWPAWTPNGSRVVFETDRDGVGLWQIDRDGKRLRPIFGAPISAEGPAVAKRPDGHISLVFTNSVQETQIWRYPVQAGTEPAAELAPSTRSQSYARYSHDGKRLAFSSTRSGYQEIWVANADGSQPVQLTYLRHRLTEAGPWSPDDGTIAFVSQDREQRQIYMVPVSGGPAVQVTNEPGVDYGTSWSRDGARYYYDSKRTGRREVRTVSPTGGESKQMTENGGSAGFESDRGFFYYQQNDSGKGTVLMRREAYSDREVPLAAAVQYGVVPVHAPCGFYYETPRGDIYLFDEATSRSKLVLKVPRTYVSEFTISPDGKWYASDFPGTQYRDLMIIENFR